MAADQGRRLSSNVWVDGVMWPVGCRPPERVAELIGDHAWEDGDPTVAAPVFDDEPATVDTPVASTVDPATLDDALMGAVEDVELDDVTPEPAEPSPPVEGSATRERALHRAPCVDGEYCSGPHCPPAEDPTTPDGAILDDSVPARAAVAPPMPSMPPRVGRGASKAAWTAYAEAHDIPIPEDCRLADIIGVVDAILAQRQG